MIATSNVFLLLFLKIFLYHYGWFVFPKRKVILQVEKELYLTSSNSFIFLFYSPPLVAEIITCCFFVIFFTLKDLKLLY